MKKIILLSALSLIFATTCFAAKRKPNAYKNGFRIKISINDSNMVNFFSCGIDLNKKDDIEKCKKFVRKDKKVIEAIHLDDLSDSFLTYKSINGSNSIFAAPVCIAPITLAIGAIPFFGEAVVLGCVVLVVGTIVTDLYTSFYSHGSVKGNHLRDLFVVLENEHKLNQKHYITSKSTHNKMIAAMSKSITDFQYRNK